MISKTISIYISFKFLKVLLAMILGLLFLIVTVDFIEQLRRASEIEDVSLFKLFSISFLRSPVFIERVFPFACLFAAMMTLTQLNNKMELVVIRAAGVSAWQFLLPIALSAALVGAFVATFYNPIAIYALQASKDISAEVFPQANAQQAFGKDGFWIKQQDAGGGSTILNAKQARDSGQQLDFVKILRFDLNGKIVERIDTNSATFDGSRWILSDATRTDTSGRTTELGETTIPTALRTEDLMGVGARPQETAFWKLREMAERVEKSGTNGNPYVVQYHSLTALPLFLVAMILVAATVCLRFVRFGQTGQMILGGILFGFVLYTVTNLVSALGSNGVVPPVVAAWSPGLVAILFGMSVLLHQEDG